MRFNLFRALLRERSFAGWKSSASIALPLIAVMAISPSAAATSLNATSQRIGQANPIASIGRVQPSVVPSVFGTVAVPFGTTPMSARWTRVMSASVNDPTLVRLTSAGAGSFIVPEGGLHPVRGQSGSA